MVRNAKTIADMIKNFKISDEVKALMHIGEPMFIGGGTPVTYSPWKKEEIIQQQDVEYIPSVSINFTPFRAKNNRKRTKGRKKFYLRVIKPVIIESKKMVTNAKNELVERAHKVKTYTILNKARIDEKRLELIEKIKSFGLKNFAPEGKEPEFDWVTKPWKNPKPSIRPVVISTIELMRRCRVEKLVYIPTAIVT